MNTITQTMKYRQAIVEYSHKHGVTKAAIRYKINRQYVYRWLINHTDHIITLISIHLDVKVVPTACIVGDTKGQKFYQYTAIDEYSRFRYLEAFEGQSSYSSAVFVEYLVKKFRFPIECIQTDNGQEFTKRFGNSKNPLRQCSRVS